MDGFGAGVLAELFDSVGTAGERWSIRAQRRSVRCGDIIIDISKRAVPRNR